MPRKGNRVGNAPNDEQRMTGGLTPSWVGWRDLEDLDGWDYAYLPYHDEPLRTNGSTLLCQHHLVCRDARTLITSYYIGEKL